MARELGVDHLVAAVGLALDEVGEATPRAVDEAGLVDHVRAAPNSFLGRACAGREVAGVLDPDHVAAIVDQVREVAGLVLVPLALDEVGLGVLLRRLLELTTGDGERELRQMLALEKSVQIRRGEPDRSVLRLHPPPRYSTANDRRVPVCR